MKMKKINQEQARLYMEENNISCGAVGHSAFAMGYNIAVSEMKEARKTSKTTKVKKLQKLIGKLESHIMAVDESHGEMIGDIFLNIEVLSQLINHVEKGKTK